MISLVKEIDKLSQKNRSAGAFVVLLNATERETRAKLKKFAKTDKIQIPLTYNVDKSAPKKFKLNESVKHTILIYKSKRVLRNFAFNKISEKDLKEISKATSEAFER